MSTSLGPYVEYKCFNDCRQTGCPGHKVRAIHHNTSNVLSFEVDGDEIYHFDYNSFKAMIQAYEDHERV